MNNVKEQVFKAIKQVDVDSDKQATVTINVRCLPKTVKRNLLLLVSYVQEFLELEEIEHSSLLIKEDNNAKY